MPDSTLSSTPLLDLDNPQIKTLITNRGWRDLPAFERIGAAYNFVRNEIAFGYNRADDISAPQVLHWMNARANSIRNGKIPGKPKTA